MNAQIKNSLRGNALKKLYSLAPFSLQGDLEPIKQDYQEDLISCLICTARPAPILEALLADLIKQTLPKNQFEIIIWDNGLQEVDKLVGQYASLASIQYFRDHSQGRLI